ncbi:DUF2089 domain-containing protein [Bacillus sp. B1-b2]|uniref:DUF2089 domain-containing protein n=1 Tax=Bacillus sp. B1-b2 TaxID=2653201 RepID=UPI001261682D|nr:DUF2089 domain-containing protein [Bacillus sp. B1-b2]KAB7671794.1 DUF2089 domain-containing protein [Bacillus sp. B1-b2]
MTYPVPNNCPVCQHTLHITKLECNNCHTTIENKFHMSTWQSFTDEQMHFIETFLISRGNIKEVEKKLGISYPTVRGKLDEIVKMMTGATEEPASKNTENKTKEQADILERLERKDITVDEAIELMKNI